MLTNYEREIAITLVEALVEYGLTNYLAPYGDFGAENWFCNNELESFGFCARGGATKICIDHEDVCGWVIKVGYTKNVKLDYAAREYQNYCIAREAGFAEYFPETVYLGKFDGHEFYVQEMADCDENQVSSEWYERLRDDYEEDGESYDSDYLWDEIYDMDDDAKAFLCFHDAALCDFLKENNITDLHEGNFGYIGSRMVIVDFSGYIG